MTEQCCASCNSDARDNTPQISDGTSVVQGGYVSEYHVSRMSWSLEEGTSKQIAVVSCTILNRPSGGPRFMGGPTPPWFSWGHGNVVGVRTPHEKMDVCFSWGGPTPP